MFRLPAAKPPRYPCAAGGSASLFVCSRSELVRAAESRLKAAEFNCCSLLAPLSSPAASCKKHSFTGLWLCTLLLFRAENMKKRCFPLYSLTPLPCLASFHPLPPPPSPVVCIHCPPPSPSLAPLSLNCSLFSGDKRGAWLISHTEAEPCREDGRPCFISKHPTEDRPEGRPELQTVSSPCAGLQLGYMTPFCYPTM